MTAGTTLHLNDRPPVHLNSCGWHEATGLCFATIMIGDHSIGICGASPEDFDAIADAFGAAGRDLREQLRQQPEEALAF